MTEQEAFDAAMVKAFGSEGGVADHAADRGGLTNLGLSLRYLRNLGADRGGDIDLDGDVDAADVLAARPADARRLFRRDFWEPSGAADFATLHSDLAAEHFDFAVVAGPSRAVRALQVALRDLGAYDLVVDGGWGDETFGEVKSVLRAGLGRELLAAVRRRQLEHFWRICMRDRSQVAFLLGWTARAMDFTD